MNGEPHNSTSQNRSLRGMVGMSIVGLLLFGLGQRLPAATPTRPPAAQIRALWVDGFHPGFRTPREADQLVADAVAAHLNLLIVQVRRRGDSFYTRSIEPPVEDDPYRPDFDALGYLLEKAHAAGLQVHAWVNVTPIWRGGPLPPQDPRHIFNLHGLNAQGDENWLTQTDTGEKHFSVGYFLDPGHPAAARHIVKVILNIVRNYPVDGIHLDYIRYPEMQGTTEASGSPVGYNPVSVERFHKRYGGTGLPAANDPRWSAWRREQVINLIRRIYLEIHALKPSVQLSAALVPWGDGPYRRGDWPHAQPYWRVFQDWLGWLDLGLLDMAIPMNYDRQSEKRTRVFFEHWIEFEKDNKKDRLMAVGLGAYMNTVEESEAQLKRVQAHHRKNADGFALYSYFMSAREGGSGFLSRLAQQPGSAPLLPARPPAKEGSLAGIFPGSDGVPVEISRKAGKKWSRTIRVITDGNGFFGATRLKPGVYRVKAGDQAQETAVAAGAVTVVKW
jgi:uncharacterized lipoprotein YddW (UPF0748 family)